MTGATRRIALVDLGMGNLRSVERALVRASTDAGRACAVLRTSDADTIRHADMIVFPGQGAFRDCSAGLGRDGIGDALGERIKAGVPYLGICLGLQALFEGSDEAAGAPGLGVMRGRVTLLASSDSFKIPHMGWNQLEVVQRTGPFAELPEQSFMYFVHSYHAVPEDPSVIAAVTRHGPHAVTAAIQRDNVTATQFHPEKSQEGGLRFLAAFLR